MYLIDLGWEKQGSAAPWVQISPSEPIAECGCRHTSVPCQAVKQKRRSSMRDVSPRLVRHVQEPDKQIDSQAGEQLMKCLKTMSCGRHWKKLAIFNIIEVIAWMPQEIFLQIFKCTQAEIKIHISMASRVPALPVDEGWEEAYFTPV